ncbi:MAG: Divergent PAP2 family protein [Candidatus Methanofastidiosum methylothiophilum]|uniref:Divergent PAP2 family protein n=1 Tax=Candidatus Methanofastidiosum methylothiophilum TaxID=1705564 RepID=A0A150IM11_9EURY|nr:MAG: Divergent PAP2 family protein [Candidatus Methanofastidiosum methylthiophilus]KYC48082.1 MAG: Divergent PAP2 family protein [Candidatus Methanofastidiosum methylthiophilus]KYC50473.1 MAG: Divergent PAP2 family protein [Candidatus Methanofastidiosum methylthiophilus]
MTLITNIINFFYNPIITPTLIAYLASVFGKIINESLKNKSLSIQVAIKDGGMPSSHTATVIGLATAIFLHEGMSTVFWVSLVFAFVVMKDATGIRWETGQQAKVINQILKKLRMGKVVDEELKELLGHTEAQVVGGFIVGVIFSYLGYKIIFG